MFHPVEVGQVYLHRRLQEYVVVIRNNGGVVLFAGQGVCGKMDEYMFLRRLPPVDPALIESDDDIDKLLNFVPTLKCGYLGEVKYEHFA